MPCDYALRLPTILHGQQRFTFVKTQQSHAHVACLVWFCVIVQGRTFAWWICLLSFPAFFGFCNRTGKRFTDSIVKPNFPMLPTCFYQVLIALRFPHRRARLVRFRYFSTTSALWPYHLVQPYALQVSLISWPLTISLMRCAIFISKRIVARFSIASFALVGLTYDF